MIFGLMDIIIFVGFIVAVLWIGMSKATKGASGEDFFLAGRGLSWWLIGFSLIAANISTEQFVGMSGNAASHVGLAIASYEWMAAITLVVIAFTFLPYFLRAGIYTMPEFLEYRYNTTARTIMAIATLFIYMLLLGSVTYSGALTIRTIAGDMGYNVPLAVGALTIGIIAMIYVAAGGLKACAWADLIQGSALILGGVIIMIFAFIKLGAADQAAQILDVNTGAVAIKDMAPDQGAISRFYELNRVRLNMFLPKTDTVLPWTALMLGLWIPNFYYWGLNQYITQRTLGSKSLSQGQRGIVFAAFLKLIIPFAIVIPGIIAFNLFASDMQFEAVRDNARVMTEYYKAHPGSSVVDMQESPADSVVANWGAEKFLLAVYETDAVIKALRTRNPYVLPISKSDYNVAEAASNAVFISEDKAWRNVYPALAAEVEEYNAGVRAANTITVNEKFIAYKYDTAMAQLLGKVLPNGIGLVGFVVAALLGAVVSSLAAMLNAASTIFTMDIFKKFISPTASQKTIVLLGRICVVAFSFVAILLAPQLGNPKISNSIFTIIQEGQGFISPGILAVFVFGLVFRKAPPLAGVVGLVTNIGAYGAMKLIAPQVQFLNRMAICFVLCLAVMGVITAMLPLQESVKFEQRGTLSLESSKGALIAGIAVVILTLILYTLFSPLLIAG
ncbi:sodium:proton symporter [candidate division KSB1 bacterium]|nr:sodium/solute symporter [candidate division KSB1 bacterium]RQW02851.1 MAG: sodium:proton symporter [candidate division KSB1 bacterium]